MKLEAADGTAVEPVAEFVYLGSIITRDGDATKEVRRRIGMASAVFATLGKVWDSSIVPLKLKSGLFRSLVVYVLLYIAECWCGRRIHLPLSAPCYQDRAKLSGYTRGPFKPCGGVRCRC